jgi:hypothetical protein
LGGAAARRGLPTPPGVRKINETQKDIFFNKVLSALWTLRGKRLAALGLAFKGDTDDIRESPAIDDYQEAARGRLNHYRIRSGRHGARQAVLPPSKNLAMRATSTKPPRMPTRC